MKKSKQKIKINPGVTHIFFISAKAKDQSPLDVQLGTNTTNTDNMVQTLIEVEADSHLKNTATEEKVQPALDMEASSRGNSISVINSSPITSSVSSSNLININLTPSKRKNFIDILVLIIFWLF